MSKIKLKFDHSANDIEESTGMNIRLALNEIAEVGKSIPDNGSGNSSYSAFIETFMNKRNKGEVSDNLLAFMAMTALKDFMRVSKDLLSEHSRGGCSCGSGGCSSTDEGNDVVH